MTLNETDWVNGRSNSERRLHGFASVGQSNGHRGKH